MVPRDTAQDPGHRALGQEPAVDGGVVEAARASMGRELAVALEAQRSARAHLALGPGVERVVDRQLERELLLVGHAEVHEAAGDRLEAARLGRDVGVLGDVGAVDDPRHEGERRIAAEPVVLDEHLERAQAVAVRVARARARRS